LENSVGGKSPALDNTEKINLKLKYRDCTYKEYKELMRIYKQKTGPLYYHLGKDVNIYDDPIFQTACKLMIYLKILAYKYQNNEAQRIIDLNLSPYVQEKKKEVEGDGMDQKEEEKEKKEGEGESEDTKKLNKSIKEIIDQYNYNSINKKKEHKYLKEIKHEDYKDTLIFCLHFFNKVIKSCEFVFPVNMFEETQLILKPVAREEIVDSEDDKDDEEEEEEDEEEKKKKEAEEEKKKSEIAEKKKEAKQHKAQTLTQNSMELTSPKNLETLHTIQSMQGEGKDDRIDEEEEKGDAAEKILELDENSDKEEKEKKEKEKG